jgi:radical SAM superfamily enzyme YgiQ (UPF0313 family)
MDNSQHDGNAFQSHGFVSLASLAGKPVVTHDKNVRILLLKPPYFTPWTPPLGIAILKSFLSQYGYSVTCFDFNVDPELWCMHHKYFSTLQEFDRTILNDGYSKLWWVLNAHMLAFANGSSQAEIAGMLSIILPIYGIRAGRGATESLIPLVENYFRRLEEVAGGIGFCNYDVVGTSTYTTSLGSSLWLLRMAKQHAPSIKTVMGGGAFADDLALGSTNLEILLRDYPFIDHVVLGEGEMLFLQLLNGSLAGKRLISLADLNGATLPMKDVPSPDFSDLNLENYYHLTIEGARSCPFQCSFCSETIQWGEYRKKPVELLAEQVIDLSRRHNVREFFMGDSLMNPYLIPFANELLKRNGNVLYDGYLRADRPVTHRKHVSSWAASGLFRVRLGIESAATNVLKAMDKKTSPEVIAEVLKTLATSGVRTTTYWIVGFPGETEEDFQETCTFIRNNHKYIYELEAHPYYYYPYGQVGSRFYQCKELYPEEVTALTHFKVWEIMDVNPTREVRYDRLKRICALASELDLPNIYTMAERYAAEDRWRSLHPLALEVYPGSGADRGLTAEIAETPLLSNAAVSQRGKIICFHCRVTKPLDKSLLTTAFTRLLECHQILKMDLDGNRYVPQTDKGVLLADQVVDLDDVSESTLRQLTSDMVPEQRLSLRLGVVHREQETELLLCGHRGMVDPASIVVLIEDLFRIYEQSAHGQKISVPSAAKTYADAATILPAVAHRITPNEAGDSLQLQQETAVRVETSLIDMELQAALVRAASCAVQAAGLTRLAVLVDPRTLKRELANTVGPLTQLSWLPTSSRKAEALFDQVAASKIALAESTESGAGLSDFSHARVLINLEYFARKAWLGGDTWKSQGFLVPSSVHPRRFEVELLIVPTASGIDVQVLHEPTPAGKETAARVGSAFVSEIEPMIEHCRSAREAEQFWRTQFGPPFSNVRKAEIDSSGKPAQTLSTADCELRKAMPHILKDGNPDYARLLAAYVIVLARATGTSFIDIAVDFTQSPEPLPLRLSIHDAASFRQFREMIEEKSAVTLKHSRHSRDVLRRFTTPDVIRFGLILASEQSPELDVGARILAQGLELALVVDVRKPRPIRLMYMRATEYEWVSSLNDWLDAILSQVSENEEVTLDDLRIAPELNAAVVQSTQVPELEESFQF